MNFNAIMYLCQSSLFHMYRKDTGSIMAEWLVRWTTKLATWVRSPVAVGLSTYYSVLGGNLTGPRLDNRGGK